MFQLQLAGMASPNYVHVALCVSYIRYAYLVLKKCLIVSVCVCVRVRVCVRTPG